MYHVYDSMTLASNAINKLNDYWGLDPTNFECSYFSEKDIEESNGQYYIKYDPNWTNILGLPIKVTINNVIE